MQGSGAALCVRGNVMDLLATQIATAQNALRTAQQTCRAVFVDLRGMGVAVQSVGLEYGLSNARIEDLNKPRGTVLQAFVDVEAHASAHVAMAYAARKAELLGTMHAGVTPLLAYLVDVLPVLQGPLSSCSFHAEAGPTGWVNPEDKLLINGLRVTESLGFFLEYARQLDPATQVFQTPGLSIAAATKTQALMLAEFASK